MATNAQYSHCMELLAFHKPVDRYAYTQTLLQQNRLARSPPPVRCASPARSTILHAVSHTSTTAALGGGVQRSTMGSPKSKGDASALCIDRRYSENSGRPQQSQPVTAHAWRFAGRAGNRDYFSLPASSVSRSAQMQLEVQREERRHIERLRRRLNTGGR
ncbi:hypothetical protein DQ04_00411130 [Trypanosoma grayi]|uniref:hypothetical protein n=1 Tax=Trypanosoma grayi TaxID=71804 RepID=UPI0004F4404E|nr:hypothetical protein DQ04_00411130 [Trypanosoma grayi]KEG14549.1 hypothetical protein DQ04_00411130 [Trypanosoma grayi]